MARQDQPARRAAQLTAAAVGIAGLLLLGMSLQIYKYAVNNEVLFSTDTKLSCLTREACRTLSTASGAAAGVLLTAAFGLFLARRRVAAYWSALAEGWCAMFREGSRLWRGLLAEPVTVWTLLVLTLIAAAVRWVYIDQPMRFDEAKSYIVYSSRPFFLSLVSSPFTVNNHPFHTLLVRSVTLILGSQPWALRLPAFLAGVACVPAVYLAARRLYGGAPALLAAALVAGSSALAGYSVNARGYTLVCLEFLVIISLATYLYRSRNPAGWLAYALTGALGLFTIPTMLYPLGVTACWLGLMTLAARQRSQWKEGLTRVLGYTGLAICVGATLYIPIVAACGLDSLIANPFVAPIYWEKFMSLLFLALRETAALWSRDFSLPLTIILLAGAIAAIIASGRVSRYPISLPAAAGLFMFPAVLLHHGVPFPRVWSFLLPVYLMLAAAGLCLAIRPLINRAGKSRQAAWAVLALALGAGLSIEVWRSKEITLSKETGNWPDARGVADTLKEQLRPGDRLLYHWLGSWALQYYFKQAGLPLTHLKSAPREAGRVWVAVEQGPDSKPLAWLLQVNGLNEKEFGEPQAVQRYPETMLYLLEWRQRKKAVSVR